MQGVSPSTPTPKKLAMEVPPLDRIRSYLSGVSLVKWIPDKISISILDSSEVITNVSSVRA
jgi:hypothetical protein